MQKLNIKFKIFIFLSIYLSILLTPAFAISAIDQGLKLTENKVRVANSYIYYDAIGHGPNVVLLHGLFGSKKQWGVFATILAENNFHVVVPDLPGYGKSVGFGEDAYAINNQVDLLNRFFNKLQIAKLSIAGNSMGGLIAAEYARKYPGKVTSLAFIGAPLGTKTDKPSKVDELLKNGKNPFIPLNKQEFLEEMDLLFTHPPQFSDEQIAKRIANYQKEYQRDQRIWEKINQASNALSNFSLHIPTLIIWGSNDQVFDVSGANNLHKNIQYSKLIIVKNGSHLLFMEEPQVIANYYLDFLKGIYQRKENGD